MILEEKPVNNIRDVFRAERAEKKKLLQTIKENGKCFLCGEDSPCCLTFHHLDTKDKEFCLSDYKNRHKIEDLKKELSKCVIVCLNCHTKIHNSETIKFQA